MLQTALAKASAVYKEEQKELPGCVTEIGKLIDEAAMMHEESLRMV
jgi:hypothetical protein